MSRMLKATISGSFRTSDRKVIDFDNVTGTLPFVDDDLANMHIRGRYAVMWVKNAVNPSTGEKLFPERIEDMRQVFIENLETTSGELSFVGKDIKEMSYEELQDLATAKDLRRIPLPKELSGTSLREMRAIAYSVYTEDVLNKKPIEDVNEKFSILPPLVVSGDIRRDTSEKMSNEEVIDYMQKATNNDIKSDITLEELKRIADSKNITYHPKIGFDALHFKVFGEV